MNPRTKAYLEAALFSSYDSWGELDGDPLDANYAVSDCSKKLIGSADSDLEDFFAENADEITEARKIRPDYSDSDVGHDFWFSRNGHGAGFFDRGRESVWRVLQKAAKRWGTVNLHVDENNEIQSD